MSEWDPDLLQSIVEQSKFIWPGWRHYLGKDNEEGSYWTFHIVSYTPDSYQVEQWIRVNHSFLVPMADYNERTWWAWIRDCYSKVFDHEIGEVLTFNGVRVFAPHHGNGEDPYRVVMIDGGDKIDTMVPAGESRESFVARTSY